MRDWLWNSVTAIAPPRPPARPHPARTGCAASAAAAGAAGEPPRDAGSTCRTRRSARHLKRSPVVGALMGALDGAQSVGELNAALSGGVSRSLLEQPVSFPCPNILKHSRHNKCPNILKHCRHSRHCRRCNDALASRRRSSSSSPPGCRSAVPDPTPSAPLLPPAAPSV